jgi:hypothetical protein
LCASSSANHAWMCDEGTTRLGVCGLMVPANTTRPSASFERAKSLASASATNVLVSRGLRGFGRMPCLRTSKVTYQIGVIAPAHRIHFETALVLKARFEPTRASPSVRFLTIEPGRPSISLDVAQEHHSAPPLALSRSGPIQSEKLYWLPHHRWTVVLHLLQTKRPTNLLGFLSCVAL